MQLVYQVDYASYDWVKLDPALPATRAVVNQYLRLYFRSPDLSIKSDAFSFTDGREWIKRDESSVMEKYSND